MKLAKKILVKFVYVLLVLLVAFNVYQFVSIKVLKQDLSTVGGYAMLEVISGSMEPTLDIGDIIIIDTNEKRFRENDIVTFRDVNGSFVTHRIIEINGSKMITQGDANNSPDEEMETKVIVGKYVRRFKGLGILLKSIQNPIVMILILIIGIVICFLGSTDKDLVPKDLSEEEKEFLEYKKKKRK